LLRRDISRVDYCAIWFPLVRPLFVGVALTGSQLDPSSSVSDGSVHHTPLLADRTKCVGGNRFLCHHHTDSSMDYAGSAASASEINGFHRLPEQDPARTSRCYARCVSLLFQVSRGN